jgi:hypothetical protein
MSRVHESLKTPLATGAKPVDPAPAAVTAAPAVVTPPARDAAPHVGGLVREARLRSRTGLRAAPASRPRATVPAAATPNIRQKLDLLREAVTRVEAQNREVRARAERTERDLAEERKTTEELRRELEACQRRLQEAEGPSPA